MINKVHINLLPNCIRRVVETKESEYKLRGLGMFKKNQEQEVE